MDSPKTFGLFPTLPAELRLKIFSEAHPYRILQLGYNFPLPFLDLPPPESTIPLYSNRQRCLYPTRVSLPALFHVCHESRQLCLSTYIPFAYTYAHPHFDTLYISSRIAPILHDNLSWYHNCARPPSYPLAQLDRIAVEFDWLDLSSQVWANGGWFGPSNRRYLYSSSLLKTYLETFAEFGRPKELLVVGRNGEGRERDSQSRSTGWEKIEFIQDPYAYEEGRSERILQYIYDHWYYKRDDVEFYKGNPPDVKIVGVKKTEPIWKAAGDDPKLLALGDEIARCWQKMEYELHGREWESGIDGSPYNQANMEKALARTKLDGYLLRSSQAI
jgi:hypothetical protein